MKQLKSEEKLTYDSNPFTLSFRAFGLFIDFARGVFIAMLVIGFLSFAGDIVSSLPNFFINSSESTETTQIGNGSAEFSMDSINWGLIALVSGAVLTFMLFIATIVFILGTAYKGFVAVGAVSAVDRKPISIGEAFSAMTDRFGTLLIAELMILVRVIGGLLLFTIPGVRAYLRYQSVPYIIMKDKDVTSSQALSQSKTTYKNHLLEVFGLSTVGAIIPVIGQAFFAPGMAMSLKQITYYQNQKLDMPPTHWLNYIGFILIALGIATITALLALIIVFFA